LDSEAQTVKLSNGQSIKYDSALIATGGVYALLSSLGMCRVLS